MAGTMADGVNDEVVDNQDNEDIGVLITVLSKRNVIDYVFPSFPVYCARLVEVKIQYYTEDGKLTITDAFVKDCEHPLPSFAKVEYSYKNACVVEVRSTIKGVTDTRKRRYQCRVLLLACIVHYSFYVIFIHVHSITVM